MKKIKILIAALLLLSLFACAKKTQDVVLFDPLSPSENTIVQTQSTTAPGTIETTEQYTTEATVTIPETTALPSDPTQIPTTSIFVPIDTEPAPTTQPTFSNPPEEPAYAPEADPELTATEQTAPSVNTVWVPTKGGVKYHTKATCSGMKDPEEVTKSEAESRGFTPCKKCYK